LLLHASSGIRGSALSDQPGAGLACMAPIEGRPLHPQALLLSPLNLSHYRYYSLPVCRVFPHATIMPTCIVITPHVAIRHDFPNKQTWVCLQSRGEQNGPGYMPFSFVLRTVRDGERIWNSVLYSIRGLKIRYLSPPCAVGLLPIAKHDARIMF
jgi:hypothetical protein